MKKLRNPLYSLIVLTLILSACNLPFGSAAVPAEEGPLATLELPPTPTIEPIVPEAPTIGSTISWFDTSTLVYVPGGEFVMGADEPEKKDFNPVHPVDVGGFWIYSTKVTREMYNLCVSLGQCTPAAANSNEPSSTLSGTALISFVTGPDGAEYALKDMPVTDVTWDQADAYCKWVGGRLPTEAEWEKTARGEESKIQPWGDETPTCDLLNFGECGGFLSNVLDFPDGMSDYMALDMAGNAYEWVNDWYQKDYYPQSPSSNPTGPSEGEQRSIRGSSFGSEGESVASFIRNSLEPDQHRLDVGFRCVIEDPAVFAPICEAPAAIPASVDAPEPDQSASGKDGSSIQNTSLDASNIPVKFLQFCANESAKLGGITIRNNITPFNKSCSSKMAYLMVGIIDPPKNWQQASWKFDPDEWSSTWFGPEGAMFDYRVIISNCSTDPGTSLSSNVPSVCAKGYVLQSNGVCQYAGSSGQLASVACPGGYSYNSETKCCTQNPPQAGNQPDQYPACGPGNVFDLQAKVCYKPYWVSSPPSISFVDYQSKLGTCEEPKPKDSDKPSQPQPTPTFCDPATGACP